MLQFESPLLSLFMICIKPKAVIKKIQPPIRISNNLELFLGRLWILNYLDQLSWFCWPPSPLPWHEMWTASYQIHHTYQSLEKGSAKFDKFNWIWHSSRLLKLGQGAPNVVHSIRYKMSNLLHPPWNQKSQSHALYMNISWLVNQFNYSTSWIIYICVSFLIWINDTE